MTSKKLPHFTRPPVVETVLGVQFNPLAFWGVQHFGIFWETIRKRFPLVEVQPPIPPSRDERQLEAYQLELADIRCWFTSPEHNSLLQIQRDRFLFNWRSQQGSSYPRYEDFVRPQFELEWSNFLTFLKDENFEIPQATECEVTYVNHIAVHDGWETVQDWSSIFRDWPSFRQGDTLPPPDSFRIEAKYPLPEIKGNLRVSVNPVVRLADQEKVIAFRLTTRGAPESSDLKDLIKWFDRGREYIVRGFVDLTSDKMQESWGRVT